MRSFQITRNFILGETPFAPIRALKAVPIILVVWLDLRDKEEERALSIPMMQKVDGIVVDTVRAIANEFMLGSLTVEY